MKPADNMKKFFKNAAVNTNPKMDEAVLDKVLSAHEKAKNTRSAFAEPTLRRTIMKSRIVKLAAAAAIIAVVVLGLFEFVKTENKSGVVWADVAQKVQASGGVIFRSRGTALDPRDGGPGHTMNYLSSTQSRLDSYQGDQLIKTIYDDFNTKTVVLVDHNHKSYIKKTFEQMEQQSILLNPKSLIQEFLSHEHRKLGQKTVDGVLCEGLETTDPTFGGASSPVDSLVARAWVSVERGYPVLLESETTRTTGDNEKLHIMAVLDQFQWDVELDSSLFEPNIPPDYMRIEMP